MYTKKRTKIWGPRSKAVLGNSAASPRFPLAASSAAYIWRTNNMSDVVSNLYMFKCHYIYYCYYCNSDAMQLCTLCFIRKYKKLR